MELNKSGLEGLEQLKPDLNKTIKMKIKILQQKKLLQQTNGSLKIITIIANYNIFARGMVKQGLLLGNNIFFLILNFLYIFILFKKYDHNCKNFNFS